jgi:hypothetical protein
MVIPLSSDCGSIDSIDYWIGLKSLVNPIPAWLPGWLQDSRPDWLPDSPLDLLPVDPVERAAGAGA